MQREEKGRAAAGHFAAAFMRHAMDSKLLEFVQKQDQLKPIQIAVEKCFLWCRAVCCLVSVDGVKYSARDVIYFLDYSGKNWFEKSMKQLLEKPGTYWTRMAQEVVRTGASSELLLPTYQAFQAELHDNAMFVGFCPAKLQDALATYTKLAEGMRESTMEEMSSTMCARLCEKAAMVVSQKNPECISSAFIDALIQGLNLFPKQPGVLSHVNELQKWMTSQKLCIAAADFLETMQKSVAGPNDIDMAEVKEVLAKMKGGTLTDACYQCLDAFLLKILKQSFHQAGTNPVYGVQCK